MTFDEFKITPNEASGQPIYWQIGDALKAFIAANRIGANVRLPDVNTLAGQCGVSLRTMEKALQLLLNDGICYRRPKKGTFVGDGSEARLRRGNGTGPAICGIVNYGLHADYVNDHVVGPIYAGMQRQACESRMDLVIMPPESVGFYEHNATVRLAGVFLFNWPDVDEVMTLIARHPDVRFVFVNFDPGRMDDTPENVHGVFSDDFAGGFEAGHALARRGHRRVAVITLQLDDFNFTLRENGFVRAMQLSGVEVDHRHVYACNKNPAPCEEENVELGRVMAEMALRDQPELTALFCVNDLLAAGAAAWLEEHGLRSQVELVGHEHALFSHLSRDWNFTTVEVPCRAMGELAVRFLAEDRKYHPKVMRIAPTLLPRWNLPVLTPADAPATAAKPAGPARRMRPAAPVDRRQTRS